MLGEIINSNSCCETTQTNNCDCESSEDSVSGKCENRTETAQSSPSRPAPFSSVRMIVMEYRPNLG